jgi:hypothetical protein
MRAGECVFVMAWSSLSNGQRSVVVVVERLDWVTSGCGGAVVVVVVVDLSTVTGGATGLVTVVLSTLQS